MKGRLFVSLGALIAMTSMVAADQAFATHAQPFDGRRTRVINVPAYNECTSTTMTHGLPLGFGSCVPARTGTLGNATDNVTLTPEPSLAATSNEAVSATLIRVICDATPGGGTPDHKPPTDDGTLGDCALAGDQKDVVIISSGTDIRCQSTASALTVAAGFCSTTNTDGFGADYTGKLLGNAVIRITDHFNNAATGFTSTGTVTDTEFPVGAQCVATGSTTTGSTCAVETTADTIIPVSGTVVKEGLQSNVEISQLQVFDMGDNATLSTGTIVPVGGAVCPPTCIGDGDERVASNQGIFIS